MCVQNVLLGASANDWPWPPVPVPHRRRLLESNSVHAPALSSFNDCERKSKGREEANAPHTKASWRNLCVRRLRTEQSGDELLVPSYKGPRLQHSPCDECNLCV